MKIKEWLKKREESKYAKREEHFRQMYIQIPHDFIDIHCDTPTAYVSLAAYKSTVDIRTLLAQNIQTIQQYKQERLALQSEYKCMDNRFKHLANLIGHLQEEVTRLSEELEEEKAKHTQMD